MTTIVLLPDGVGVRNFLLGPFIKQLAARDTVHLLSTIPEKMRPTYSQGLPECVQWNRLFPYRDRPVPMFLRKSLVYAHLYWANTRSMQYIRKQKVHGSLKGRVVDGAARAVGRAFGSSGRIQVLDRLHCRSVSRSAEVRHYQQLFRRIKPSVLFCSHQRPLSIMPAVLAARALGIPTATFIFSWDNLTSKGRIAAPFDHYLVWSAQMRDELLHYYPDVSASRVHIVGTPQFDPYADCSLLKTREDFFNEIGADPGRPLICYSGNDVTTGPQDPEQLEVFMKLISTGQIKGNPQVVLRPAPVDDGNRYDEVRQRYPQLIYSRPAWAHADPGDWERVIPLPEDVQFLTNLTHHADINVNTASTMTLDFALHDKPVVNIAFDISDPPIFGVPLWDYYYKFEHYRPVVEMQAARFARSPGELAEHINAYLDNPALDAENRRKLIELEVGVPLGQSSEQIIVVLAQIARQRV